jgi:hypothetical protein
MRTMTRYSIATTIITALVPACPRHATGDLCWSFARLRLVVPESPTTAANDPA